MNRRAAFRAMSRGDRQHGVALPVALMILIILTLLGVAAMRAGRLQLRLSQNEESRMNTLQQAQSVADAVIANPTSNTVSPYLAILPGTGYAYCYISPGGSTTPAPANSTAIPFNCTGATAINISSTGMQSYVYAQSLRNAPEFITTSTVRSAGMSARAYDFASFNVIGGYDNSGYGTNASNGMGAAEVQEGAFVLHAKATGVNYQ